MNDTEINDDSIARVRRNDATVTSLSAYDDQFTDQVADSLGRALQGNNHVTKLSLNVYDLTVTGNYDSLLNSIEQSATLEEIKFVGVSPFSHGRVVDRFLNATSSSHSIRKVELYDIRNLGTNPFLSLLRSSVSDLTIDECTFADTSQEGCRVIAAGFRENASLQRLDLIDISNELIAASLNGVRSHPAIRHLTVEPLNRETETTNALSDGIRHILSSTSTLTSLELRYFQFSARNFEPIAQELRSNQGVNTLELAQNDFDREATDKLVSLFQNSSSIDTLKVWRRNLFRDASVEEVISRILRSNNNTLENLDVSDDQGGVPLILETLQNNRSLKTLKFDSHGERDLESLQRSLPKLRGLKKLTFRLRGRVRISAECLLQAFERNGSLEEVEIIQNGFELFNAEALAKIRSFCLRNKKLPSFLAASVDAVSPSRTSRHPSNGDTSHSEALSDPFMNLLLRPKVYTAAQKIEAGGNRMIFRDLIRLGDLIGGDQSSDECVPNGRSGKRKRSDAED